MARRSASSGDLAAACSSALRHSHGDDGDDDGDAAAAAAAVVDDQDDNDDNNNNNDVDVERILRTELGRCTSAAAFADAVRSSATVQRAWHAAAAQVGALAEGMAAQGWRFVCESSDGVTVTRARGGVARGVTVLRAEPRRVLDALRRTSEFARHPHVARAERLLEIDADTAVVWLELQPPASALGISKRALLLLERVVRHAAGPGSAALLWVSAPFPVPRRRARGVVLAALRPSGFLVEPMLSGGGGGGGGGAGHRHRSLVTFVGRLQMRGWVPTALTDGVVALQPTLLSCVGAVLQEDDERVRQAEAAARED